MFLFLGTVDGGCEICALISEITAGQQISQTQCLTDTDTFSYLPLVLSGREIVWGFMCPRFEISLSEISASTALQSLWIILTVNRFKNADDPVAPPPCHAFLDAPKLDKT